MEFSKYVFDVIKSIDYVEKDHDYRAVSLIREAAKNAPTESDSHILDVIVGVLTIFYEEERRSFGPFIMWNDGRRSFALEDLEENDHDILCGVIQCTGSSHLRTKFSHVVWTLKKNNQYGKIAVAGYIDAFEKSFDPDNWVKCYEKICAAYHIASTMGKKAEGFRQTKTAIDQKLIQMNGADSLFLSLKLLDLILQDASKEELQKYEAIIGIMADRNINPSNQNTHLADSTFSIQEQLYGRMKNEVGLKTAKTRYANYYETQAKSLAQKNSYVRAVDMLKKACILYKGINQEKQLELRSMLEDWQKRALKEMHVYKFGIDLEPIYDIVAKRFEGLSLMEAIVQFGRSAKIYHVDDVKNKMIGNREHYVSSSMFGSSLLNGQGQTVQELPSIRTATDSGDLDAMKKHMVHYVAERRRLSDVFPVGIAYQFLNKYGSITEDDIDFLVSDNIIVPENRKEIIKQGLCLGLNGKLYAAMHILQPQTEHIFRNLVKLCGDTVTFLKGDGSEEYKPLSSLFKSPKLQECYNEDIIFTFQSIMDDPAGENLRNLNAHGLLEPEVGNSAVSLYFVSLLISLLSLYGSKAWAVRMALSERERIDSNKTVEKSDE